MTRNSATYYYHKDALGNVTEVSNSSGTKIESYTYDIYGEVTIYDSSDEQITESAISNPYLFTGRRYDKATGLYYYRARYYSAELGRFLSRDPIGYKGGINLYAYVGNNPVNLIDPLGLCGEKKLSEKLVEGGVAIGITGGVVVIAGAQIPVLSGPIIIGGLITVAVGGLTAVAGGVLALFGL